MRATASKVRAPIVSALWDKQSGVCALCGEAMLRGYAHQHKARWASIDHITPLSKGGSNELGNLRLACRECNEQRGQGAAQESDHAKG